MDEVTVAIAKLQALQKTVANRLAGQGRYFDPPTVLDYFERYEKLRDQLKGLFPDLYSDIPVREIPKSSGTTDNEGRGYIERTPIGLLRMDMTEMLEIWERSQTGKIAVAKKSDVKVEGKVSPADRIIEKIKRHRLATVAIVIGTITIAVGSFFGAITEIAEFIDRFVDPKPTTVIALQDTVRGIALELKESFNSVTSGLTPPIPDGDFDHVKRLIKTIERLDPGNGHVIYYRGFITRWRNQRPASHTDLFWYLERARDPNLHMRGDNGDAKFCFDNWRGYCKQRQAFINHVLALDFEQATKEEKDHAVALARLKAALDRAETAIKLYGEFNGPGQGTPTRTLAESLRRQIFEREQLLGTATRK